MTEQTDPNPYALTDQRLAQMAEADKEKFGRYKALRANGADDGDPRLEALRCEILTMTEDFVKAVVKAVHESLDGLEEVDWGNDVPKDLYLDVVRPNGPHVEDRFEVPIEGVYDLGDEIFLLNSEIEELSMGYDKLYDDTDYERFGGPATIINYEGDNTLYTVYAPLLARIRRAVAEERRR